ncbi:serine/threonine protein kinase [Kovacikia minuta CCNUW1]|uniref:serine/threonine-protein kinase n=1 Tax=Kovacikia minuta TaxID=2931930 RepID=UPI001CD0377E|nr:serine/threonine-protein kinase [Kovacikia minuta]UBF24634.1 serine/threonine protein kinase [Kovacikia minuta CCNUW1]
MSHCLNPHCSRPQNSTSANYCIRCGFKLLLGDRYRAVEAIARGGFGRTFLAVDEYKPSRPQCVIKQFFPYIQSDRTPEQAQELFRREAIQLEQLGHHPQIPALLAHFEQANYQYLVQEFIDGRNLLQELSRTGVFSEFQVWQLLNDLLPVLQFIHSQQVIHRDVKPQNIIRRRADQRYVLVDFGAAKSITADLSMTGTSIGSPEFVAPEQAIGKAAYASDLYSLGVSCIYLLTQVRPADLFDTEEGTWVWRQHLTVPVSGALSKILNKLLQGPTKFRYQSATEVLNDLNAPAIVRAIELSTGEAGTAPVVSRPSRGVPDPLVENFFQTTAMPLATSVEPEAVQDQIWTCKYKLTGHTSWVRSVAIHPDGNLLASGSGDKTVKLWNLETGELLHTIAAHSSWVRAIATSPNGQTLASCSNDKTVKLWDWQSGELLQTLEGHTDWVRSVAFSPDGYLLASSSQDKSIRIWRVATGETLKVLTGHRHWVTAIGFQPEKPQSREKYATLRQEFGRTIVSGSRDRTIRIWNEETGKVRLILEGHTAPVNAIALAPNGKTLASCSDDTTIKLWDLDTGSLLHTLTNHEGAVNSVAISSDGKTLVSGSHDRTVKLWNLETATLLHTATHASWVWSVAISPNGSAIASGCWDGTVSIWVNTGLLD